MTLKKERAEALARMTKVELVKTIKTLDARQLKLLNRIAELEAEFLTQPVTYGGPAITASRMPWEGKGSLLPNPFEGKE